MHSVGLDCSGRSVGWAVVDPDDRVVTSGTKKFKAKRGESVGMFYLQYRKWLENLFREVQGMADGVVVAYEMAHFRGGYSTEIALALQTRAQELSAAFAFECCPIHSATAKKFATGNGKAKKPAMIAAAKEILGRDPVDDNEADAVHMARWAHHEFVTTVPLTCVVLIKKDTSESRIESLVWLNTLKDLQKKLDSNNGLIASMFSGHMLADIQAVMTADIDEVKKFLGHIEEEDIDGR